MSGQALSLTRDIIVNRQYHCFSLIIFLGSNFWTHSIHSLWIKENKKLTPMGSHCQVEWRLLYFSIITTLNESRELFSHLSGILPLRAKSLFVKVFKPTFFHLFSWLKKLIVGMLKFDEPTRSTPVSSRTAKLKMRI